MPTREQSDSPDGRVDESRFKHRFYHESLASCQAPVSIELGAAETHHALHVLRLRDGQGIELFDGSGHRAVGTIERTTRRACVVTVEAVIACDPPVAPRIHIASALPKARRQDWLVEKITELGAASFTPLLCERSSVEARPGRDYLGRWRKTCIAAAGQCRLDWLTQLHDQCTFSDFILACAAKKAPMLMAHCGSGCTLVADVIGREASADWTILIGPEGGWSDGELHLAGEAGVRTVILGDTVLRIETAAVAMLAAVRALSAGAAG